MNKRAQDKIDTIMGRAFDDAMAVLEPEIKLFLRKNSTRYSGLWFAVGWGPTLIGANGKTYDGPLTKSAERLMAYVTEFYDSYGADNRKITA